jgi:hypothetical protein
VTLLAVDWASALGLFFTLLGLVVAVVTIPRLVGGVRRQQLANALESASATIDLLEKTNRIQGEAGVAANGHLEALRRDVDELGHAAERQRGTLTRALVIGVLVLALVSGGFGLILVAQNNRIGDTQADQREADHRIECRQATVAAYEVALGDLHMAVQSGNQDSINESATALATAGVPLLDLNARCGAPS